MIEQLLKRLRRTHTLYVDLVRFVAAEQLGSDLAGLPSNTIGAQLWCVVGARNSYTKAAVAGAWQGFESPLTAAETTDPEAVIRALESTFEALEAFLTASTVLSAVQEDYLFDLLEHEAQHHGQLIRYLYGLGLGVPDSWKERYNLD